MDLMAHTSRLLLGILLVWSLAASQVKGQELLDVAESEKVARLLASGHSPDLLHCSIEPRQPALDFALRIDVGYIVTCPLAKFGGRESRVFIFARVTPEGGKPVMLYESYRLPAVAATTKPGQMKQNVQASGGFAVGEGHYQVEVLVLCQETGWTSRKSWRVGVARSKHQGASQVALPPGSVLPIGVRPWPIKMDTSGRGLRLTVLLDAAPLNPHSTALHAWDRTFLLGSLSSLLKQIPCASVRFRAFNLDQQRELFRQDQLDDAGFIRLADSLRTLELGVVSYSVLQQHEGWLDMLLDYANGELTAADPSDAVVFLGPRTRYFAAVPREKLRARETPNPHFYYFEYSPPFVRGNRFPDTVSTLTKRLDGTVYEIFSPSDLALSIQRMLARVQPRAEPSTPGRWPPRPAPTD